MPRSHKNSEVTHSTVRNIGKSKDHVSDGNVFSVNLQWLGSLLL